MSYVWPLDEYKTEEKVYDTIRVKFLGAIEEDKVIKKAEKFYDMLKVGQWYLRESFSN